MFVRNYRVKVFKRIKRRKNSISNGGKKNKMVNCFKCDTAYKCISVFTRIYMQAATGIYVKRNRTGIFGVLLLLLLFFSFQLSCNKKNNKN